MEILLFQLVMTNFPGAKDKGAFSMGITHQFMNFRITIPQKWNPQITHRNANLKTKAD
jgi:hypothetical protein